MHEKIISGTESSVPKFHDGRPPGCLLCLYCTISPIPWTLNGLPFMGEKNKRLGQQWERLSSCPEALLFFLLFFFKRYENIFAVSQEQ